ncbi:OLC1v1032425C1 [Oldenlandia corymbosa var. corymbosa]|uniref:OLC1v1032425C1 n=1 Tax=Oldenlandia corymbosa var. corymbosa TaxID=529605 RepID=A0AAV1CLR3_OLDCO|nr:OLC1v1032425C1 [Oldenlandia corymbosa var. corymbosa]
MARAAAAFRVARIFLIMISGIMLLFSTADAASSSSQGDTEILVIPRRPPLVLPPPQFHPNGPQTLKVPPHPSPPGPK